jgi:hypothetical protein
MSKDPAFLLYPQDFLVGTMTFTNEQVGKYVRMLCFQHQSGHLTEEDMMDIAGDKDPKIWRKFKQDEEGLYYNERLEQETIKRRKYTESRKKNLQGKPPHMESHMENVNEDVNVIEYRDNVKLKKEEHKKLVDEYGKQVTELALDKLDNYKGATGKKYKSDYRAILSWVIDEVKTKTPVAQTQKAVSNVQPQWQPKPLPETWSPMPESLKKRISKIGNT